MAIDLETGSESSATQLVSGIITDAQDLIKQQMALFRHEINDDFRKTKEAGFTLIWGMGIAVVGGVLLCLMLVHLLSWAAPELRLWICYGIVGAPVAAIGSALLFAGNHKLNSFNPMTDQSAQSFKENVEWITNQK